MRGRFALSRTISRAEWLAAVGIATLRYNFPYAEQGTGRDSQAVCTATVRAAVAAAQMAAPDLLLLAGGHSFGGRMTSTAVAESPWMASAGWSSSPFHCTSRASRNRSERSTSML
jgi:uncharacterized protein